MPSSNVSRILDASADWPDPALLMMAGEWTGVHTLAAWRIGCGYIAAPATCDALTQHRSFDSCAIRCLMSRAALLLHLTLMAERARKLTSSKRRPDAEYYKYSLQKSTCPFDYVACMVLNMYCNDCMIETGVHIQTCMPQ